MTPRKQNKTADSEVVNALRPFKEAFYRETANDPKYWFKWAQSLWSAAELIWLKVREAYSLVPDAASFLDGSYLQGEKARRLEESDQLRRRYEGPALLLSGYAVENVLKAVKVKHFLRRGAAPVPAGSKSLDRSFKAHKLDDLATSVNFPKIRGDSDLLRRLTQFTKWAGRYPVDLVIDYPTRGPDFGTSSTDADDVAALFRRLCEFYDQQ